MWDGIDDRRKSFAEATPGGIGPDARRMPELTEPGPRLDECDEAELGRSRGAYDMARGETDGGTSAGGVRVWRSSDERGGLKRRSVVESSELSVRVVVL